MHMYCTNIFWAAGEILFHLVPYSFNTIQTKQSTIDFFENTTARKPISAMHAGLANDQNTDLTSLKY